jgi:alpha/beta superfamily hydrolase
MAPDASPPAVTIRFAHGKDSSPRGVKIQRLSLVATRLSFTVESPDYSGTVDPEERVRQLVGKGHPGGTLVLVGSSMGSYVSTVASSVLEPEGLFLMAPAFYIDGYADQDPVPHAAAVEIVHGWGDEVIPVEHSIRFARRWSDHRRLWLHLLPGDHRLEEHLPQIEDLFGSFLRRLASIDG